MTFFFQRIAPICTILLALLLIESGVIAEYADARGRSGGRSFSRPAKKAPTSQNMKKTTPANQNKGSFSRGLAGGLLGGALGGMLFGSLFGASGNGMGLLPILLLGGVGFFLYRRFTSLAGGGSRSARPSPMNSVFGPQGGSVQQPQNTQQFPEQTPLEEGIAEIQQSDSSFDNNYFVEVASDVFFQVQAGWARREHESFKHLLGEQLSAEYAEQFSKMREAGQINKLESIAIRKVEVLNAGSDGQEDFVTVLFTANLLDYTVDEKTDDLISGSMTTPVKFAEEWSWARSTGTENWLLEGIKDVS